MATMLRVLLAALGCLMAAPAQAPRLELRAERPIAALARMSGQEVLDSVPAGTLVGGGPQSVRVSAVAEEPATGRSLRCTALAYQLAVGGAEPGFLFSLQSTGQGGPGDAAGTSNATALPGARLEDHAYVMTVHAAPGTTGTLWVRFLGDPGIAGQIGSSLDVGADGSVELSLSASRYGGLAIRVPSSGRVPIRILTGCRISGSSVAHPFSAAWSELTVGFVEDTANTCRIAEYGAECGLLGSALESRIGALRSLNFLVSGAPARQQVVFVLGTAEQAVPLPGGCNLLATPEYSFLLRTDPFGTAGLGIVLPVGVSGTVFQQFVAVQDLGAGQVQLLASNGLRIDCP